MDKKEYVIIGIVIIIAIAVAGIIFSSPNSAKNTQIQILNNGSIGENGTIYIKLTDMEKNSLGDKPIKVSIIDKKGKAVYTKELKTHVTGMALVKVENITPDTYTVNVTFNGDANYSSSSLSKKINIVSGHVEEQLNATSEDIQAINIEQAQDSQQNTYTPVYSTDTSYTPSSSSSQQSSSDSRDTSSDDGGVIDENGNAVDPVIDENGNEVAT
ncbi:hypothetical protein [Methanobrevibacter sp.]|uniref:hypothetical protein n=1 Tax=Methanobrevibacter sp. TaxID=66852 RepID=UPI002E789328|nr:hypothetical protein [Methanobrevibacter sp.]MEE0939116.1 hypothetical protein [Methanobrevibacter sp.]